MAKSEAKSEDAKVLIDKRKLVPIPKNGLSTSRTTTSEISQKLSNTEDLSELSKSTKTSTKKSFVNISQIGN